METVFQQYGKAFLLRFQIIIVMSKVLAHGFHTREFVYESGCRTEVADSSRIFIERCPILDADINSDMILVYSQELSQTLVFDVKFLVDFDHDAGVILYVDEKTKNNAYLYGTVDGESNADFIDICGDVFSWKTYEVLNEESKTASEERRIICGNDSSVQCSTLETPSPREMILSIVVLTVFNLVFLDKISVVSISAGLGFLFAMLAVFIGHSLTYSTNSSYYIVWKPT